MNDYGICPSCKEAFKVGDIIVSRVYKVSKGKGLIRRFVNPFDGFFTEDVHLKCPEKVNE